MLNRAGLAGVRLVPVKFTPKSSKFANEECGGVNVVVTDRSAFRPVATGVEFAYQLNLLHSGTWKVDDVIRLLVNRAVLGAIKDGKSSPRSPRFGRRDSHSSLASGNSTFSTEKGITKYEGIGQVTEVFVSGIFATGQKLIIGNEEATLCQ